MKDWAVETPRLHLRRMTLDDVPALLRVFGDSEVMRLYPVPFDEARMLRWVAWNQKHDAEHGHGLWAVILRATGECVGDCWLVPQQVDSVAEITHGADSNPLFCRKGADERRAQSLKRNCTSASSASLPLRGRIGRAGCRLTPLRFWEKAG